MAFWLFTLQHFPLHRRIFTIPILLTTLLRNVFDKCYIPTHTFWCWWSLRDAWVELILLRKLWKCVMRCVCCKYTARLEVGRQVRDRNTMTRGSGKALIIPVVSTGVNREGCRWIKACILQTVVPLCPKCAISQTMKSQKNIRNKSQKSIGWLKHHAIMQQFCSLSLQTNLVGCSWYMVTDREAHLVQVPFSISWLNLRFTST